MPQEHIFFSYQIVSLNTELNHLEETGSRMSHNPNQLVTDGGNNPMGPVPVKYDAKRNAGVHL